MILACCATSRVLDLTCQRSRSLELSEIASEISWCQRQALTASGNDDDIEGGRSSSPAGRSGLPASPRRRQTPTSSLVVTGMICTTSVGTAVLVTGEKARQAWRPVAGVRGSAARRVSDAWGFLLARLEGVLAVVGGWSWSWSRSRSRRRQLCCAIDRPAPSKKSVAAGGGLRALS